MSTAAAQRPPSPRPLPQAGEGEGKRPLRMILRFLALLGRHATSFMVGGIFIGLALPGLAAWLHPLLPYFVFLLAAATMIRIEVPEILAHAGRPLRLAVVLLWGLVLSPIVTAALVAGL